MEREGSPDYSYEVTVTDDTSTEIESIARSEQIRNMDPPEQAETVARVQAKVGSKFVRELGSAGLMDQEVVQAGIVEGARRMVDRFGNGPNVPPLYGRAVTAQPTFNPNIWNPCCGEGPGGPGGGGPGGPGGGGPGGPGGGRAIGGPAVPMQYAWFQRGEWNPIRQEFRQSFHDGAAPPGPDIKLAKPPTYDGLQRGDEAEIWIQQVECHFYLQPHLYVNDQRGIAWATSFLWKAAYEWYMPYWKTVGRTDHPATRRWAAFVHAFTTHFSDSEAEAKAEG